MIARILSIPLFFASILQKLGWRTVHVAEILPSTHGDFQITDIHDLHKVLPEFWPDGLSDE